MNVIWLLLRASWLNVVLAIVTGLISGGCSARLISLINSAISGNTTAPLIGYFAGLAILALLTSVLSRFLLIDLTQDAVYHLRLRLSQGILAAPLRHLEELGANRLLATLTEDVQTLSNTVFLVPFICIDVAIIIGCLSYLWWLSGSAFLVVVMMLTLAIASVQLFLGKARHFLALAREEEDRLFKHFHSITDGIKELKLHTSRRQAFFTEELQSSAAVFRRHSVHALKTFAVASSWGQLLFFTIVGLLLFGLPKLVAETASFLPAYILTMTFLMSPLQNLLEQLPGLFRASVALRKVEKMRLTLARQAEIVSAESAATMSQWQSLEIDEVFYTYPGEEEDEQFTLGKLNLTIYAGEWIFIVGGNGSGKSTLAKLIAGLYVPDFGEIRLDGKPITERNREWYRQNFSAIFSDFYLFERFLGMSRPDLDRQARDYLQQFHLERKVKVMNSTLSTTALSQGQRKRLALLTAYLEDRPIYLFDEWAADQDPLFRDIFYHQLLPDLKQRGKTILAISHDDRYFHLADRVIKLDYGKMEYDRQMR